MSDYTMYHNPRCTKSRQTLALLEEHKVKPVIRFYLEFPPTIEEMKIVLKKLGIPARKLLRKGEQEYKDLDLKNPELSEQQLIEAMVRHPRLIERPIVVKGNRAVLGRPPENVLELL